MKAVETNLLKFLQGTKQFIIPIYQRKYSWTLNQCRQLWNDIVRAAEDETVKGHFVGSIVYIERGLYQISSVPQLLVIDGQQRLTTLTLFLLALGKAIEASGQTCEITKRKIMNYYLVNNDEEGDQYNKLILTKSDKDTLLSLISDKKLPDEYSQRVYENYTYFYELITKSEIDLNKLHQGIAKLIVVDISLDRDHDNPQLIFESLNSTGLDLSQADLIRNFVLMKLEPKEQTDLYTDYWYPMERNFGNLNDSALFDRFMRDYLTVKTGKIPNIHHVYAVFKEHVTQQSEMTVQEIVEDIYRYSKHFVKLAFQTEKEPSINQVLTDINTLRVDVSYPFLLEVYDDYEQQKLSKDDFVAILKLVESYVFRRAICGVPTNSLNKTFASISKEISKDNYLESATAAFLQKESHRRFPKNEEFVQELVVKDVYNFRMRNYLLRKLENFKRKEVVDIESYTIEHIMPQNENLSSKWQQDLGANWAEVQKTYLHTLGNLTLTRYNSELSDRPFLAKRDLDGGFADSPLRLNRGLGKLDAWNETEINKRARSLADKALQVWEYPQLSEAALSKLNGNDPTAQAVIDSGKNHPGLQGEMVTLFEELSKRICNLDSSVRVEVTEQSIVYKTFTPFVEIVPHENKLVVSLGTPLAELNDPKQLCREVSEVERQGTGETEVEISSADQIEDVMSLIRQSFEKHRDDE